MFSMPVTHQTEEYPYPFVLLSELDPEEAKYLRAYITGRQIPLPAGVAHGDAVYLQDFREWRQWLCTTGDRWKEKAQQCWWYKRV